MVVARVAIVVALSFLVVDPSLASVATQNEFANSLSAPSAIVPHIDERVESSTLVEGSAVAFKSTPSRPANALRLHLEGLQRLSSQVEALTKLMGGGSSGQPQQALSMVAQNAESGNDGGAASKNDPNATSEVQKIDASVEALKVAANAANAANAASASDKTGSTTSNNSDPSQLDDSWIFAAAIGFIAVAGTDVLMLLLHKKYADGLPEHWEALHRFLATLIGKGNVSIFTVLNTVSIICSIAVVFTVVFQMENDEAQKATDSAAYAGTGAMGAIQAIYSILFLGFALTGMVSALVNPRKVAVQDR